MRRLILVLILLVGGCTPVVQADVTRFHAFGPNPAPGSFTIVPDTTQAGSLEFQDYASQVASALEAKGWRPVPPGGGPADAHVSLHWGVGAPEWVTWYSPSSVYSGVGWGPRTMWYGSGVYYDPFPYWEARTITYYPGWVEVKMSDAHSADKHALFEGRAVTAGTSREIAPVMPYLIRALFTGFPGNNGATVRVEVPTGS
jgi:hypothetical protein